MSPVRPPTTRIRIYPQFDKRTWTAPWVFEPPSSESFNVHGGIALPAIAVGTDVVVLTFTVPEGRSGVINLIANMFIGGGFQDFSGNIIWKIRRNGFPERNYENIVASLGLVSNPSFISPIRLVENDVIDLTVQNVNIVVAGQLIGGRLGGYFYPRALDANDAW